MNVLRTLMEVDTEIKGPSMDTLKNQKNVLDAYMIERCQDLKPWEEVGYMKSALIFRCGTCGILDNSVKIGHWRCLESKLLVVLQETGVYVSKGIDPTHYSIKFRHAQNVPKQGGVFGDCGVFDCLFLYRLAHGIPLVVEDPIQIALEYREKMINFFFTIRSSIHLSFYMKVANDNQIAQKLLDVVKDVDKSLKRRQGIIDELKVKKGMRAWKAVTFYKEVEHREMEMRQQLMLHIKETHMRTFEKREFVEAMKKL
ncbi:phospholipase-like protein [Tanacetum coccineum]